MAACLDIVAGGVLERHPGLHVAFLESGLGWLEYWLDRPDGHFDSMRHHVPWMNRRPTELFREQCFISIELDEAHPCRGWSEMGLEHCVFWAPTTPTTIAPIPAPWPSWENLAPLPPGTGRRRALADGGALPGPRLVCHPEQSEGPFPLPERPLASLGYSYAQPPT